MSAQRPLHAKDQGWVQGVRESFLSLNGSLWLMFVLKCLESFAYFASCVVFTLFLSEDFGLTDGQAGLFYGVKGGLTSLYGLGIGFLIDRLGPRKSLIIGSAFGAIGRLGIGLTRSKVLLWAFSFGFLPFGQAMSIPVMTLAIKGYTTPENRGFAFGLFYSIMNVGALLSGFLVDGLTLSLDGAMFLGFSANRWVFIVGGICTVAVLLCAIFLLADAQLEEGPVVVKTPVLQTAKELLTQKSFWRFLAFTMITINLKSVFRHLDATFPKYLVREFGDKVPKGSIYSINPFIIIGLVPVISALTQRYEHFDMIHFGSYISAASVFLMAISTSIWASIAFVVVLSLGEALWSPRFYDYTVSVAPRGKEGTFMALSSAPLFLSTLPVGALSGYLLEWYCPEKGPRDSKLMWGIIGMVTASSPLLITLFQGWVREPKHPGKGHDPTAEEDRSEREMDDVDVL
eukprot:CAMPEP_0206214704 /NCGR_PEP_ID=MMETSP0047_2-20121206/1809_1 /ASSEMBLY_ACC=CAM_ASM_000192 /TAXON_ID=195065 /ORGANISM="Chroomonas mesostigmatica_cf, Strain CCMP1168" /LENGTH=457 /DNA_ID=CAMNT_0053636961 /DNA_START=223 /DNA_END=1593 /DNA_ORIENTATION=-